jgi:hypothetical protein
MIKMDLDLFFHDVTNSRGINFIFKKVVERDFGE